MIRNRYFVVVFFLFFFFCCCFFGGGGLTDLETREITHNLFVKTNSV